MFVFSLLNLFSLFNSLCVSLNHMTSLRTVPIIKNIITNYKQDVEFIRNFKDFFDIESYNYILNNLNNNKIDRVYIDTHYKELVFFDNFNFNSIDGLQDHSHLSFIDPIVINNLIQKINDHHIPIYFVDFTSNDFFKSVSDISKILGQFSGLINSSFSLIFLSLLFYRFFYKLFLIEKNDIE